MDNVNWLIFVVIYLLADSFRIFLDNYISDAYFKGRGAASQKIFHGAIQVSLGLIMFFISGLDFAHTDWLSLAIFCASGFVVSLAGIPYFKALELDDSTNLGIFMQLSPVLYLIFGWLFFHETIAPLQIVAFVIILAAPLIIIKTTSKRSQKVRLRAVFYAFLYVLISVVANLVFAEQTEHTTVEISFLTEIAVFFIGKGLASLLVVGGNKKWRHRFSQVVRRNPRRVPRLLLVNVVIGLVADAAYRMALAAAPIVAIASAATDSVEPIVIFFMGLILTLINPKFGREKLQKKTILVHLGATILVVIGVALIQFQA